MGLNPHNPRGDNMAAGHLQCNLCGYVSNYAEALNSHMRIHSNERPYECKYCGKRSKLKSHNEIHMKRLHLNQGKPYKCVTCGRDISSSINLKRHMKKEHGITMPEALKKPPKYTKLHTRGAKNAVRKADALKSDILDALVGPGVTPHSFEEVISAVDQWKERISFEPDLFKPELPLNMIYQDPNYFEPGLRVRVATEVKRTLMSMRGELDTDSSFYIYTLHDPSLTKVPMHRILAAVDEHTR